MGDLGQSSLLSMSQSFSGLPMDSLIGGPLNAAASANGAMAVNQVKFMLDTCFHKKESSAASGNTPAVYNYDPIMINMTLTRQAITPVPPGSPAGTQAQIQPVDTNFSLPLLTIIPLNSLAVKTVDITFEMEVKSSYGEDHSNESSKKMAAEASFEAKVNYGVFSASVKGSASYSSENKSAESSHYEKSNSAKYTVNVTAGQLPLPDGVKTIIDAYAGAVDPITLPVPAAGSTAGSTGTTQ
ncbi:MAG: hypothetical protein ACJAY8_000186 [Sphingobacteriales bacterium]|jgi:hypothetical protein